MRIVGCPWIFSKSSSGLADEEKTRFDCAQLQSERNPKSFTLPRCVDLAPFVFLLVFSTTIVSGVSDEFESWPELELRRKLDAELAEDSYGYGAGSAGISKSHVLRGVPAPWGRRTLGSRGYRPNGKVSALATQAEILPSISERAGSRDTGQNRALALPPTHFQLKPIQESRPGGSLQRIREGAARSSDSFQNTASERQQPYGAGTAQAGYGLQPGLNFGAPGNYAPRPAKQGSMGSPVANHVPVSPFPPITIPQGGHEKLPSFTGLAAQVNSNPAPHLPVSWVLPAPPLPLREHSVPGVSNVGFIPSYAPGADVSFQDPNKFHFTPVSPSVYPGYASPSVQDHLQRLNFGYVLPPSGGVPPLSYGYNPVPRESASYPPPLPSPFPLFPPGSASIPSNWPSFQYPILPNHSPVIVSPPESSSESNDSIDDQSNGGHNVESHHHHYVNHHHEHHISSHVQSQENDNHFHIHEEAKDDSDNSGMGGMKERHSGHDEDSAEPHAHESCGFQCLVDEKCIGAELRCDSTVHCSDGSDEHDCDCLARIGTRKLCDGVKDCPYGEDEAHCYGCNSEQFSCKDSNDKSIKTDQICIAKAKHCDGVTDCPNALDEHHCFRFGAAREVERGILSEGLLQKMIGGTWYFICKRSESPEVVLTVAHKACRMIVGDTGEEEPVISSVAGTSTEYTSLNYAFMARSDADFQVSKSGCPGKRLVHVQCPEPMCGFPVSKHEEYVYSGAHPVNRRPHESHGWDTRYARNIYSNDDRILGKVVGGYDSRVGDWPFLVAIYRNGSFHCGGSLIDRTWILTAAHCTHNFDRYVFEAHFGQVRRYSWSPYEQSRMITEIHVHERYDNHIFSNDIALMKIDRPVHLSKWVTTACFAHDRSLDPEIDEFCTVIGWGDLAEDGTAPDHMQEVSLPVRPCHETFTRENIQICAGYDEGGKDACQGDSGGPFVCRDYHGRLIVNGLVSFGRGCARAGQLGVYTRISAYRKWIDSIVSGQSESYQGGINHFPRTCPGTRCHRSGGECIFDKMHCDQVVDCLYGDDEVDCNYTLNYVPESHSVDAKTLEAVREATHSGDEHTHGDGGAKLCHETDEFQCRSTKTCVPISKRCDTNFDCSDKTDERDCDCSALLENSHPELMCNGLAECEDEGDEVGCDYCDGEEDSTLCVLSAGECIPKSKWCDGTAHCTFGEDEADCFRIVREKTAVPSEVFLSSKKSRSLLSGYVFYRREGMTWQPACEEEFGTDVDNLVCPYLSLSTPENQVTSRKRNTPRTYVHRKLPVVEQGIRSRAADKAAPACNQTYIKCGEPSCGERRLYSYSAGKTKPVCGNPGTHPWLATVLTDGKNPCPASLLNKQWAVTSSKCLESHVKSLKQNYVAIKAGQIDPSLKVSSPTDQLKRVNYIKKEGGLSFIHLDKSVQADHFAAPLCTDFGTDFETAVLDFCVLVSMTSLSFTFSHIEVKSGSADSSQFTAKLGPSDCNATTPHGAFVYCSTDGDGIHSWYFVGYLHQHYCTVQEEVTLTNPFFGSEAKKFEDLIRNPPPSTSHPPNCKGIRCSHGNCVPKTEICDKILQCQDGQDERRCKQNYQIYRAHADEDDENDVYTNGTEKSCAQGHFQCTTAGNCVPLTAFCDGFNDCGTDDPTDEPEGQCTCRQYLELVAPWKICDGEGRIDCPDRSDERGCPCRRDAFRCGTSETGEPCIHRSLRCDGRKDCPSGTDEAGCVALSAALDYFSENKTSTYYSGYVLLRVKDEWHPYCSHDWSTQVGSALCRRELGYKSLVDMDIHELRELREGGLKVYQGDENNNSEKTHASLFIWSKDGDGLGSHSSVRDEGDSYEDCTVAYVICSN